jgi:rhodanese-related sulfurtransferase
LPARVRPQDADDEVPDVEIVNVLGGMTAWNAAGYPTTSA